MGRIMYFVKRRETASDVTGVPYLTLLRPARPAKNVLSDEALTFKSLHHTSRHGLVVFLGVAYVGEYLCESFLVVYLYELAVFLSASFSA